MREHGDALEADFEHYYGIDIVDVYRGHISARKASVLALNLPPGALTWQEVGTDNAWTVGDFLLAEAVDALNIANYQRQGGKGERPEPTPRPAQLRERKEKRAREMERASRFLERQRRRMEERG